MTKKKNKISSCKDCTNICCKIGPGPYTIVNRNKFLENFGDSDGYNTKCDGLRRNNTCKYWKTKKFPQECRQFVCQNRLFSKKELEIIENIDETKCWYCGCPWTIYWGGRNFEFECEICEAKWSWKRKDIR